MRSPSTLAAALPTAATALSLPACRHRSCAWQEEPAAGCGGGGSERCRSLCLQCRELFQRLDRHAVRRKDLHAEQVAQRVFLEALHHRLEHVEGLLLIGHQRVLLRIAAQSDAFLQVIHRQQVVLPQAVEHRQHDHALVVAQRIRPKDLLLGH